MISREAGDIYGATILAREFRLCALISTLPRLGAMTTPHRRKFFGKILHTERRVAATSFIY